MVTPAGHPLARKARVGADDLARHPLVLMEPGHSWRAEVDDALRAAGVAGRVRVALEVGNPLAALRFASLGLGPTVVPASPRGIVLPGLVGRPLAHLFPPQYLVALWRKGAKRRPQAEAFIAFARRGLAEGSELPTAGRPSG
jgi:DNA-binding transcriptional LysR family regulator